MYFLEARHMFNAKLLTSHIKKDHNQIISSAMWKQRGCSHTEISLTLRYELYFLSMAELMKVLWNVLHKILKAINWISVKYYNALKEMLMALKHFIRCQHIIGKLRGYHRKHTIESKSLEEPLTGTEQPCDFS